MCHVHHWHFATENIVVAHIDQTSTLHKPVLLAGAWLKIKKDRRQCSKAGTRHLVLAARARKVFLACA